MAAELSTKPYLLRAIYEWCADNGYTPYIAVAVDERTRVPREYVRNGEIVLNVSASATNRLVIGNEMVEFQARFGGVPRDLSIPVDQVSAIYARENGHGMAFDVPKAPAHVEPATDAPAPRAADGGKGGPRRGGPVALSAVPAAGSDAARDPEPAPVRAADEADRTDESSSASDVGSSERATTSASDAEAAHADDPASADEATEPGTPDGSPEPAGPGKPGRPRLTRIK